MLSNAGQENTSYATTQLDLIIGFKMLVVLIDVYLKKEKEKVPKQRYKYNLNKLRFVDIMSSLHLNNTISFSSWKKKNLSDGRFRSWLSYEMGKQKVTIHTTL